MKRRNLFKLAGYGGVGLATTVQGTRSLAAIPDKEKSTLPSFDFATIKVNRQGLEKERTYHSAKLYIENLDDWQKLSMVSIPQGKFIMGASAKEKYSSDRERPVHEVKVAELAIGEYPITQVQWRKVAKMPQVNRELKLNTSHFKGDKRPVESVSWLEAIEFCEPARCGSVTR